MAAMPGSWDTPDTPASGPAHPNSLVQQNAQTYIRQQMLSRRAEYLGDKEINIKVGSWNIGNFNCFEDIKDWFPKSKRLVGDEYDIYALGLQEVVDINNTQTFLKYTDPKIALNWKAHVQAALPPGYECVASVQLIGILMLVFVSPNLAPLVSSTSTTTVGTGLMGYVGNKGGVGCRLVLGGTLRLTFVDCHLAAFANAVDRRNWDAAEIQRRMWFEAVEKDVVGLGVHEDPTTATGEGIDKSEVVIWCGDMNYRVDLDNADIRSLLNSYMPTDLPPTHADIRSPIMSPITGSFPRLPPTPTEAHPNAATSLQETLESLLKHDQLLKQRQEGRVFAGFKEGKVKFLPTYKYDVGTVGVWDSSEKARAPSWCDRIMWRVKGSSDQQDAENARRARSTSVASSILIAGLKDEILFETTDDSDSDEEDLVVSRGESPIPHHRPDDAGLNVLPSLDDSCSVVKTAFGDIKLQQLTYTSHQNISTSDHKPVSATFSLTFPAVDPTLRTKIHAEAVREVDKLENERRPVVTVIVDQSDSPSNTENIVEFADVRFWEHKHRTVTIANTGTSTAPIQFVTRPAPDGSKGEEVICKPFLSVGFAQFPQKNSINLEPGEVATVNISILVSTVDQVLDLNDKREVLDDVLVLRVEGGRDVFIPISATWLYSSYGTTLKELVKIPEKVGGFRGWREAEEKEKAKDGPLYSAPREIYRISQFLCDTLMEVVSTLEPDEKMEEKRWFAQMGWPFLPETRMRIDLDRRRKIEVGVWEALDTDSEFSDPKCLRIVMDEDEEDVTKDEHLEAITAVFLRWLEGLKEGIVPASLWDEIVKAGGDPKLSEQVLDHLPERAGQVHANVFIYLVGFVAEAVAILVTKKEGDKTKEKAVVLGKILDPISKALVRKPEGRVGVKKEDEARRAWVRRFVEM